MLPESMTVGAVWLSCVFPALCQPLYHLFPPAPAPCCVSNLPVPLAIPSCLCKCPDSSSLSLPQSRCPQSDVWTGAGCVYVRRERKSPIVSLWSFLIQLYPLFLPLPSPEDHKLVFLQQGPLLLVAMSRTSQSAAQLRGELLAVHAQIVSTLTRASVARIFAHKQNYDLRRLLAGSERTLDRLLDSVEQDPGALLLGAVRCVPLARPLRDALGALLRRCTAPGLALSVLAVGGRLITAAQERNVLAECRLDPADLQLLLDWVGAPAFAAGEAWAPVCLPRFNPDGFFYAYVARLDAMPVCLLLLGTQREAFHAMAACRRLVEDGMHALGAMRVLGEAASFSNASSASAPAYSVQAVGAPGLRHFLYKPLDIPDHHRQLPQFTR